jgi:hypothetical protein
VPTGSQLQNIGGQIFETGSLPGRPPAYIATKRNWLGLPIAPRRCGPVDEVVESYWLSEDEGGWEQELYGRMQRQSAGLTTGHL